MSEETKTVDEAILAELKALREEVKLLREQAKVSVVVMPGYAQTIYVQQPAVYHPAPLPWNNYPTYGSWTYGIGGRGDTC